MIRFTNKAIDHLRAAFIPESPMRHYVKIYWDDGDINNGSS
jgi:hypothetical protein